MIPKKIHYFWIGGKPLPKLAKKCIKSWRKYCPDYEIIEWNEKNYDFSINCYMKEAYEAQKWGFVPDYARLDIIYRYGGIYLDTDVELRKNLDNLLHYKGFAGFESNFYVNFGLGFGAEAGNSTIKDIRDSYKKLHFINEDGTLNLIPSPKLNTKVLQEKGLILNNSFQYIEEMAFFPTEFFCPISPLNGEIKKTQNTISVHHIAASWFDKEQQRNKRKKWRKMKLDRIVHFPNRMGIKLLGEKKYECLKKMIKR